MTGLAEDEFSTLMATIGPFEEAPVVAVGVSGGCDSMALILLCDRWARRNGGRVIALTVDHRLRADSAAEAAQVGDWCARRGIEHRILTWDGEKPRTRIQETAREARYGLLSGWCRENGVLHLAIAHNREDQAETFLMRLTRGSGTFGLAATSAVVESGGVRIIRPLLGVSRERLRHTLREAGQDWIEDPSNRNPQYRRVRVRDWLPALAFAGCPPRRLAALAADFAETRVKVERRAASLIATSCRVDPAGYALLDAGPWENASDAAASLALARLILTLGGGIYAPRPDKTGKVLERLRSGTGEISSTLGRCRFVGRGGSVLVCRESRGLPVCSNLRPGERVVWDRRFVIRFAGRSGGTLPDDFSLSALGRGGWGEVVAERPELRAARIPYAVRVVLPAIRDSQGVLEVPHLGYRRPGTESRGAIVANARFAPLNTFSGNGFCLARAVSSTISSGVVDLA